MDIEEVIKKLNHLEKRVEALEKLRPKRPSNKTDGSIIWEIFSAEIEKKYGVTPLRNAKTNRNASDLVKRLGVERAKEVIKHYVSINNDFYEKNYHDISLCLKDCEKIYISLKSNVRTIDKKTIATNIANKILWAFDNWGRKTGPDFDIHFQNHIGQIAYDTIVAMGGYNKLYNEWNTSRSKTQLRAQIRDQALIFL